VCLSRMSGEQSDTLSLSQLMDQLDAAIDEYVRVLWFVFVCRRFLMCYGL